MFLQIEAKAANNDFAVEKQKSPFSYEVDFIVAPKGRQFAGGGDIDCFLHSS